MKRKEQLLGMGDVERPRLDDALYEEPQLHSYAVDPEDGLPRLKTPPMDITKAPKFSPDRFVCSEDARAFVDPVSGDSYPAEVVERSASDWYAKVGEKKVCVIPRRPKCQFYKRQLLPFEDTDKNHIQRMCTAGTNENGEFYSLNGQEVLACEFRQPYDVASDALIREHEQKIIAAQEAAEEKEDDFDPVKELGDGLDTGLGTLGG